MIERKISLEEKNEITALKIAVVCYSIIILFLYSENN